MESINDSSSRSEGWTRRKIFLLTLSMSPFIALLVLLAWGQLKTGGNPGGLLVHNESGEVQIAQRQAPEFSGTDLVNDGTVDNASVSGKIVMVDFWSSWCTACRIEASDLSSVYEEYSDKPVEFVGLAIWDETGDVLRYVDRYNVGYPVVIDDEGSTAVTYGVRGVPEKFFLDENGTIIRKVIGPLSAEELRDILDSMLES
jgi:thiol-disulfide isomerase/thioredoxin